MWPFFPNSLNTADKSNIPYKQAFHFVTLHLGYAHSQLLHVCECCISSFVRLQKLVMEDKKTQVQKFGSDKQF